MCVTFHPAKLSDTILYGAESFVNGKLIHILGYQNQAYNNSFGSNAMILPFPSSSKMGPENIVDMSSNKNTLKTYAKALIPMTRGSGSMRRSSGVIGSRGVQIFESGMYTIILAEDASDVFNALGSVPENKRPNINKEVLDFYSKYYSGWSIALCCFESRENFQSDPMVWWYEPLDKDVIFLPALDSHDGKAPNTTSNVHTDHSVIFGSMIHPVGIKISLLNPSFSQYFATRIVGEVFSREMVNGEW